MLACELAVLLGLPVCDPNVVEVPRALIGEAPETLQPRGSVDLEFASAFPHPLEKMLVTDFLPERLLRRVTNLAEAFLGAYVFDLWTCNRGRREAIFVRPADAEGAPYSALLIDHDACFDDGNWSLPRGLMPCTYARRTVYENVRDVDSFEPVLSRLENLAREEIEDLARGVPVEWYGGHADDILRLADRLFDCRQLVREAVGGALPGGVGSP